MNDGRNKAIVTLTTPISDEKKIEIECEILTEKRIFRNKSTHVK